jgi:hypothetical protein
VLREKARSNYIVADYAEKNHHYDAAASRYYYHLYELMLVFLIDAGLYQDGDEISHSYSLEIFTQYCYEKLGVRSTEMMKLKLIKDLWKQRKTSDYRDSERISNSTEFSNCFLRKFQNVKTVFNEYNIGV